MIYKLSHFLYLLYFSVQIELGSFLGITFYFKYYLLKKVFPNLLKKKRLIDMNDSQINPEGIVLFQYPVWSSGTKRAEDTSRAD